MVCKVYIVAFIAATVFSQVFSSEIIEALIAENWEKLVDDMDKTLEERTHLPQYKNSSTFTNAETRKVMIKQWLKDLKEAVNQQKLIETDDDKQKYCEELEEKATEYYKPIYDGFYRKMGLYFTYAMNLNYLGKDVTCYLKNEFLALQMCCL